MTNSLRNFISDEDGLGTVEIVIIIAILVGLALIFRKQIYSLVNQIFDRIFGNTGETITNPDDTYIEEKVLE